MVCGWCAGTRLGLGRAAIAPLQWLLCWAVVLAIVLGRCPGYCVVLGEGVLCCTGESVLCVIGIALGHYTRLLENCSVTQLSRGCSIAPVLLHVGYCYCVIGRKLGEGRVTHGPSRSKNIANLFGASRESNPGPPAPRAEIIPLDHMP